MGEKEEGRGRESICSFPSSPLTFSVQSKASPSLVTQSGVTKPVRGSRKEEEAAAGQAAPPCRGSGAICAPPAKP